MLFLAHGESRSALLHDKAGDPTRPQRFIDGGKDDRDIGLTTIGGEDLGAVKDIAISVTHCRSLQRCNIASSTSLSASLPHWAHDGGRDALLARLRDPAQRQQVREDPVTRSRRWDRTVIAYAPDHAAWEGRSVTEIAADRGQEAAPAEAAFDLLLEGKGRVSVIHFGMCEGNLAAVLRHPAIMIGSDGSALSPCGPLGEGKAHPRNYGTFPRVLGKYAREEGVLSMPEAVRKMTGLPASRLGLGDRGLLRAGWAADLVLFNAATVRDMATFADPYRYPQGIDYVFVNGQAVITPDGHSGALPGRVLDLVADGPAH